MPSAQRRLIWILLAVVVVLVCVAAGAVAAYVVLRERPATPTTWQDPVSGIDPDKIAPDLALYPLAGASLLETIDEAIANGELYTAYSTLVFAPELTDAQRSGRLLLLGKRFIEAEEPDMAERVLAQVNDLAVLSPRLNDPLRADALLGSGRGWADLGKKDRALAAYDQALTVALRSPYLQTAYRRELLENLAVACTGLGETAQADVCRQEIAKLDQRAQAPVAAPVGEPLIVAKDQEPISTPEIGALEEGRRQAAFAVLQTLASGSEPAAEQLAALGQALLAEDQAKLNYYRAQLEGTTQPSRRASIHAATVRWLTTKYQVAGRGYGRSLVPDWEANKAAIQSELSKAYEALRFDYEDAVTSMPDASLMEPGRYEVWRWLLLAGRLGQYPNYPAEQIAAKLQESVRTMIAAGIVEPLFVAARAQDKDVHYLLVPAVEYEQAMP